MFGEEFIKQLNRDRARRIKAGLYLDSEDKRKLDKNYYYYYNVRGQKYNDPNNWLQLAFGDWEQKEIERKNRQEEREKLYQEEIEELENEIASLVRKRVECQNIIRKANPEDPDEKERAVRAHFEIIRIDNRLGEIDMRYGLVNEAMVDGPKFPRKVRKIKKKIKRIYSNFRDDIRDMWWSLECKFARAFHSIKKFCKRTYKRIRKFSKRNSELIIGIATAVVGYIAKRIFSIPATNP